MMAGAFGFGPLSPFGGASDDLLARALAQAASGGPAGFSGPAGMGLPPAPALATVRPRPFGFGGLPVPEIPPDAPGGEGVPVQNHPLRHAERHAAREQAAASPSFGGPPPGAVNVPLPRQRPPEFDGGVSSADMPVQGAVPAMGQAPAGDQGGGSMLDGVMSALSRPGVYNTLLGLGTGLLSTPGIGRGIAAGIDYGSRLSRQQAATDLAEAEYGLKRHKLAQETQGRNSTVELLTRNGHSVEDARAMVAASAAGNGQALSNALSNAVPKNAEPSFGWVKRPDGSFAPAAGGPEDPAYKRVMAQASAEGAAAGKPEEPFNLSPGQVRYDASGRPIASAPKETDGFDREAKLRGEFAKGLGTFQDVHDGYGRVIAATRQRETNPSSVSPASDIGLVFGFMKMLDPGSVVREGEYATAKNAAGIPDQVRNAYNKAVNGEFLTSEQRQDFVGQAGELYGTARKTAEGVAGRYRGLAGQYGVDPDRATYLPEAPVAPTFGAPRGGRGGTGPAGTIPAGAADMLRGNPSLRSQFDQKYGAGAADAVLGRR